MAEVNISEVVGTIKSYGNVIKTLVLGALIVASTWVSNKVMKDSPKGEEQTPVVQAFAPVPMPSQPTSGIPTAALVPASMPVIHPGASTSTLSFLVQSVGKNRNGKAFLNSQPDYRSPGNQVIVLEGAAANVNLESYKGRIVSATGTMGSYRGQSQLVVTDPTQIR